MPDKNKVKFGLRNVHYAKLTIQEDGSPLYGTVMAWPGAVSIGLDAEGDSNTFYADDTGYYVSVANNGYSGDFESALIPDDFAESIMKNAKDTNGVEIEDSSVQPEAFALLFEFEGDKRAIRHVLYNCKMTRSSVESKTNEDSVEPQTETGTITASPLVLPAPVTIATGVTVQSIVKGKTTADTTTETYQGWYGAVYVPGAENPKITQQPQSVSVAAGSPATFTVAASVSDGGTLSYQWQSAAAGSGEFANISTATTASYAIPSPVAGDTGKQFRCIVTNTLDTNAARTYSEIATLTVTGG